MRVGSVLAALLVLLSGLAPTAGEESRSAEALAVQSLPLRTALHHDPTLASPLRRLVELYTKAGRVADLIGLYSTYLQQYPKDLPARVVHVRLLRATNAPEAQRLLEAASQQHPANGFLHYLLYESLTDEDDTRALEELALAIANEPLARRKRTWVERLLTQALAEDRRKLAADHLPMLAELLGGDAEAHLLAARRMHDFDLHARAMQELEAATQAGPAPEIGVEIDLLAATLAVALGKRAQAAERLDALLSRLTADYWRRAEILRRRARLVSSSAERDAMLAAARAHVASRPEAEAAVLDLAQLLRSFERPREALAALQSGGALLPASMRIEQETLALFLHLRDEHGRAAYLAKRLSTQPDRQDLREHWVRSLFLLGRKDQATQVLDALLAGLEEDPRLSRLMETARFLHGRGLSEDAIPLYERIVTLRPQRLDVRRALAETLLATGDNTAARRVLSADIPAEVAPDLFLDLLQSLVQRHLYPAARVLLDARLGSHPDDLDVHLLSIRVNAAVGRASSAAHDLAEARPLADTPSRYRRWLTAGVALHTLYDDVTAFLDGEQARVTKEPGWTPRAMGRLEAFLDISVEAARIEPLVRHLRALLQGDAPPDVHLPLRRRLATLLGDKATDELRSLMREDVGHADVYRARLALLHRNAQRLDLAQPLLQRIDVRQIDDARLLGRLLAAQVDVADGPQVLAVLRRLTEVEPTARGHWEKWVTALTRAGDERTLRTALRRLLRGVPHMKMARATQTALRAHLGDSYWRSISRQMARQTEAGRLEALALLDEVEHVSTVDAVPLWLAWSRAFLHNERGHRSARDEALEELERLAGQAQDAGRIHFPDGVSVSLNEAKALLTRRPSAAAGATPGAKARTGPAAWHDRRGPQRANHVRWVFDAREGRAITAIRALPGGRLLVTDDGGSVLGLDRRTGKVLWQHRGPWLPHGRPALRPGRHLAIRANVQPVLGPDGAFYLPERGGFSRYHADGRRHWHVVLDSAQPGATPVSLAAGPKRVFAYEADTGEVACFSADAGRLLWLHRLDLRALSPPVPRGCGIVLRGGRLLVYGPRTAILDTSDGSVLWTFEPSRVRTVPLTLEDEDLAALFGRRRRTAHSGGGSTSNASANPASHAGLALPLPAPFPIRTGRWGGYGARYAGPMYIGGRRAMPGVAYVTAAARARAAAAVRSHASRTAVVSGPASWAGPLMPGASRLGLLTERHLILCRGDAGSNGQALVMDFDLPMFARTIPLRGTYVGQNGNRLGLLDHARLLVWQPERARQRGVSLASLGPPTSHPSRVVTWDGPCAYVTGPTGLTYLNLATMTPVLEAPWPPAALAKRPRTARACRYDLRGLVTVHPQMGWVPAATVSGVAVDGTLFTLSAPNRLVALDDLLPEAVVPSEGGDAGGR